jgi:hypothetical protein
VQSGRGTCRNIREWVDGATARLYANCAGILQIQTAAGYGAPVIGVRRRAARIVLLLGFTMLALAFAIDLLNFLSAHVLGIYGDTPGFLYAMSASGYALGGVGWWYLSGHLTSQPSEVSYQKKGSIFLCGQYLLIAGAQLALLVGQLTNPLGAQHLAVVAELFGIGGSAVVALGFVMLARSVVAQRGEPRDVEVREPAVPVTV